MMERHIYRYRSIVPLTRIPSAEPPARGTSTVRRDLALFRKPPEPAPSGALVDPQGVGQLSHRRARQAPQGIQGLRLLVRHAGCFVTEPAVGSQNDIEFIRRRQGPGLDPALRPRYLMPLLVRSAQVDPQIGRVYQAGRASRPSGIVLRLVVDEEDSPTPVAQLFE